MVTMDVVFNTFTQLDRRALKFTSTFWQINYPNSVTNTLNNRNRNSTDVWRYTLKICLIAKILFAMDIFKVCFKRRILHILWDRAIISDCSKSTSEPTASNDLLHVAIIHIQYLQWQNAREVSFVIGHFSKMSDIYRPHPKDDGRLYFHFVCMSTPRRGGGGPRSRSR